MAVLNLRVEDADYEVLKDLAAREGVSLSEFVRAQLAVVVHPVGKPEERGHGDEATMLRDLSVVDRKMLSMMHRILARLVDQDETPEGREWARLAGEEDGTFSYQMQRAKVLEDGLTGEYWKETANFYPELSKANSTLLMDILDMFQRITLSLEELADSGVDVEQKLRSELSFKGFDFNDELEAHMAHYTEYLLVQGRWTVLQPQWGATDGGNSHSPSLEVYRRMLAEFRRILAGGDRGAGLHWRSLSLEELHQLERAMVHPMYRRLSNDSDTPFRQR